MSAEIPLVYTFPGPASNFVNRVNAPDSFEQGPKILLAPVNFPVAVYCYDEHLKKKYYGNLIDIAENRQIIEIEKITIIDGVKTEHVHSAHGINTEEDKKLRGSSTGSSTNDGWYDWKRVDNNLPIITLLPKNMFALQFLFA